MKKWKFWLLTVFVWVTGVVLVEAASDLPSSFTCSSDSAGSITCVVPGMPKPVSIIGNMGMIGNKNLRFNFISGSSMPNRSFACTWNQETKRYDCIDQAFKGDLVGAACQTDKSVCKQLKVRILRPENGCGGCNEFDLVASKKDKLASFVLMQKFSYKLSPNGLEIANLKVIIRFPPGVTNAKQIVGNTLSVESDLKHPGTLNASFYAPRLFQR